MIKLFLNKAFLFFLLSIIAANVAFAQGTSLNNPVSNNVTNHTYTFKFVDSPSENEKISNYFIEELAKSIPKILSYTKYSFAFNETSEILKKISNNGTKTEYTLVCKFDLFKVKDVSEVKYKGFNISDVLMPSLLNCSVRLFGVNGALIQSINFNTIKFANDQFAITPVVIVDSVYSKIKEIKASDIVLYYSKEDKSAFDIKTKYINSYYASEFKINEVQTKIQKINLDNVDMIKVYDINLDEVETVVSEIESQNYVSTLKLTEYDPILFIAKFDALKKEVKRYRITINQMMANLDKVLYNKGLEYLSNYDTTKAVEYFQKSIVTNPYYAPANYHLAKVYLYQNKLEESGKLINTISSKMNPDQSTLKLVIILAKDLYKAYLLNSEVLIKSEDYHKAIALIEKAKGFCAAATVFACDELIQKQMSTAKYGVYNSFLIVSKKAIEKEIFDLAEMYILKARTYQKENSTDIISGTEADDMLKQVAEAYVKKGLLLNAIQKYDTALTILKKAKLLCTDYQLPKCNDKLDGAITAAIKGSYRLFIKNASFYNNAKDVDNAELQIAKAKEFQKANFTEIIDCTSADSMLTLIKTTRYYKNISDGKEYLYTSLSSKALDKFLEARVLEKSYKVIKDKSLDSLIRVAAKPYIQELLEKASVKVWGNEIGKANAIADSATKMQALYQLKSDSVLNQKFNDLSILIFNKICSNAKESYNENYRNAYASVKNQDYISVNKYFNACVDTVAKYSNCGISDSTAVAGKAKYIKAAEYQSMIKLSNTNAGNSNYKDALEKYTEAGNFFTANNIAEFGLNHLTLQKFISFQKDNNYIYFCSNYFLKQEKFQDAMFYLDLLRIKGYPSNYTVDIQETLAQKFSAIDFKTDPKQKPSKTSQKILSTDSYYKYFHKAYSANWKALKKAASQK